MWTVAGPKNEDIIASVVCPFCHDGSILFYELGLVVLIGLLGICFG